MVQKLVQYELEIERITEWLLNNRGDNIKDRDTFDLFFKEDILDGREPSGIEKTLLNESFRKYTRLDTSVSKEREFTKAGGKDLTRDKLKRARVVTKDFDRFRKLTAQQADFQGLDTPRAGGFRVARVKGRVVRATVQTITRRKKPVIIFRAKNGQFASRQVK